MAQTVRRQTKGVRSQARAAENSRRVHKARSKGSSLLGWLLGLLPFTDEQLRRAFTVAILGLAGVVVWLVAEASGASAYAGQRIAQITQNAGYVVRHVEVRGLQKMNGMGVRERALGKSELAMVSYDVDGLREELLQMPWVKDARVARQLPNVLVIDIIEREEHAVVRRADHLLLIDATGVELAPVSASDAEGMLLLEGPGVQGQVEALSSLLDAAPALRTHVTGAEWVGNRRWNLTFDTSQQLALPEGEARAAAALIAFAQADGVHRLIGGEVASFDMRNPPRMFMRVPGRAEGQELTLGEES